MDRSGSDAGIGAKNAPQQQNMDAVEKMLAESNLSAKEVYDFAANRLQSGIGGENPKIMWFQLSDFKPQSEQEATMIKFLRNARSDIATLNDDETFTDLNISARDLEQFKLRYGGDYHQNLERLAQLKRRFESSLPALDENGDGVLSKPELKTGADNSALDESTRKFADLLHSDFENLSGNHFATKYNPGYRAIGLLQFESMERYYDFSRTSGIGNSILPGYMNSNNRIRLKIASWLDSADKKGIFGPGQR
ncbi:MAG: hypothetical protein IPM23_21615 [Candidatus Melainabacteria bacterium]|nr:hypothetical protein [Candidatus Melainabacteria bacterium]